MSGYCTVLVTNDNAMDLSALEGTQMLILATAHTPDAQRGGER